MLFRSLIELARVYPGLANESQRHALASRALVLLETPDERLPESVRLHRMGEAKILLESPQEAVEEFRRALEVMPNQIVWRLELIQLLSAQGDLAAALTEAEIAAAIAPEDRRPREVARDLRSRIQAKLLKPVDLKKDRKS